MTSSAFNAKGKNTLMPINSKEGMPSCSMVTGPSQHISFQSLTDLLALPFNVKKKNPVPSCTWPASFHNWPKRSHGDKPHITMLLTIRKSAAACKIQQLCGMSQALKWNIWLLELSTLQILLWVLSSIFSLTNRKVWSSKIVAPNSFNRALRNKN